MNHKQALEAVIAAWDAPLHYGDYDSLVERLGPAVDAARKAVDATPRLFWWRSETIRNYAPGHIAVVAYSAEEAREIARAEFIGWLKANRFWLVDEVTGEPLDDDDKDDIAALYTRLEGDIAPEPTACRALFVSGSE